MADFDTLQLERVGDVLRVTIAHPTSELNAVDERLHHDLTALFALLRREDQARAVVLTGRGRRFSRAAISTGFRSSRHGRDGGAAPRRQAADLGLLDVELPIVAA
jgi:enoyl-CoA hydratase